MPHLAVPVAGCRPGVQLLQLRRPRPLHGDVHEREPVAQRRLVELRVPDRQPVGTDCRDAGEHHWRAPPLLLDSQHGQPGSLGAPHDHAGSVARDEAHGRLHQRTGEPRRVGLPRRAALLRRHVPRRDYYSRWPLGCQHLLRRHHEPRRVRQLRPHRQLGQERAQPRACREPRLQQADRLHAAGARRLVDVRAAHHGAERLLHGRCL